MMKSKKSWREKLESPRPAEVQPMPASMKSRWGVGTLLIPRALDVDMLVRRIRKGRLTTLGAIRARLAKDAGATIACPLVTGIHWRIVAEASEEDRKARRRGPAPWWRVVRDDGRLNEKLAAHAARLRSEGHAVTKGRVAGFARRLQAL
ncbi:MAG: hypothetical protein FD180_519 [Planctomycetota bacterium]|nr:MAG: hypothetical protein FD180_519 [Planctomycetota bacterium]